MLDLFIDLADSVASDNFQTGLREYVPQRIDARFMQSDWILHDFFF